MTFSRREKVFVLAGGVVALVLLFRVFVNPLMDKVGVLDEQLQAQEDLLNKYRKALNDKKMIESRLVGLKDRLGKLENSLLHGETPTLASANLQSILERMFRKRKAEINSINSLKPVDMDDYSRIAVGITFHSDIRSLSNLLYDIGARKEVLSVVMMKIHLQDHAGQKRLRCTLRVVGLARKSIRAETTRSDDRSDLKMHQRKL